MNRVASPDMLLIELDKGEEKYVFYFGDTSGDRCDLLRLLGRFAQNKELSFNWRDAAEISQRVRQL